MKYLKRICLLTALWMSVGLTCQAQCTEANIIVPTNVEPYNKTNKPKTLTVETKGIKELKIWVYNTRGTKVFESTSDLVGTSNETVKMVDTGWDGTSLGEELAAGVYVYSMIGQCLDKSSVKKSGTIVLTIEKHETTDVVVEKKEK